MSRDLDLKKKNKQVPWTIFYLDSDSREDRIASRLEVQLLTHICLREEEAWMTHPWRYSLSG